MNQNEIIELVARIAHEMGVPVEYALKKCAVESSFNPNARNPSGASGLFQIMPFHNVNNVFNPEINTRWAMQYALDNKEELEEDGFEVTPFIMYLAHQQGQGGARAILRGARQNLTLAQLSPRIQRNVRNNMPPPNRNARTCQEWIDGWQARYDTIRLPKLAQELIEEYDE